MADERLSELRFMALGEISRDLLDRLVAEVSRHVAAPCRIVPGPSDVELRGRLLDGRSQIDGDHLLQALEGAVAGPGLVVGVTGRDLGRKVFRFIFGLARAGGPAVLVSTARLDPTLYGLPTDPALIARRACAEVMHELGHAFGAGHCRRADCLMHFSPEVESIDLRGVAFCGACARELPEELISS